MINQAAMDKYSHIKVWTPNVITLSEALLTVLQFGLLRLHAYAQDKRWPYLSLPLARSERPEDWVPAEESLLYKHDDNECYEHDEILQVSEQKSKDIVDIFSIHMNTGIDQMYQPIPNADPAESLDEKSHEEFVIEDCSVLSIWRQQFLDAFSVLDF